MYHYTLVLELPNVNSPDNLEISLDVICYGILF